MKKLLWMTTAVAAAATGTVLALPGAEAATTAVHWGACPVTPADPRQECGTVRVPLDYRHPAGRQISLAVSRIPAADPAKRRGVLLVNPGGPGGEGLTFRLAGSKAVLDAYDQIGFDPRGVGHSAPVTCGFTAEEMLPPQPYPAADGSIARNVTFARSAAARCEARSGDLLPHVTTANTARDLDRIRAALGEAKISYYGLSYGTYLGAAYASMFPARTDRIVLDSAVDPARVWYDSFRLQSQGIADRFPDAASYAAARGVLGTTPAAVTRAYLALASRLDTATAGLSGNVFRSASTALLSQDAALPYLTDFWTAAAALADGTATPEQSSTIQQILGMISLAANTSPGVPADNALAAAYAVVCGDVRWPRDIRTYARNVAADRKAHPLSAGAPANIWPCAFWPDPIEPPVAVTGHGPRNVLILQNLRDPNTPLAGGRGMRKALGERAALVTANAGGHGAYGTAACATAAADTFLAAGHLPARDRTC
ncbi:alpha/beta fold hydrolase [Symbioplanes lichenis]|uniref:alpha/beta fold hydrolase n=1 Tax=Symbioplanes lichenis TaxID=1629072 RepID=UPI00273965C8|nr:alpha/beta fold hydrolase [Actinoplanes lichenis]